MTTSIGGRISLGGNGKSRVTDLLDVMSVSQLLKNLDAVHLLEHLVT